RARRPGAAPSRLLLGGLGAEDVLEAAGEAGVGVDQVDVGPAVGLVGGEGGDALPGAEQAAVADVHHRVLGRELGEPALAGLGLDQLVMFGQPAGDGGRGEAAGVVGGGTAGAADGGGDTLVDHGGGRFGPGLGADAHASTPLKAAWPSSWSQVHSFSGLSA